MSIDTLHPRPWRQSPYQPADVIDAVGELVLEAATPEAAAHIVAAVNASHEVGRRALAVEEAYERERAVL